MKTIRAEDVCNDTYGRVRMRQALIQRLPEGTVIPCENTIQKIMKQSGFGHSPLLSRNFSEQRKLRIHNGFSHLGHEIIVENFV